MRTFAQWKNDYTENDGAWYLWNCKGVSIPIKSGRVLGTGSDGRVYIEAVADHHGHVQQKGTGIPLDECALVPKEKWHEYDNKYICKPLFPTHHLHPNFKVSL